MAKDTIKMVGTVKVVHSWERYEVELENGLVVNAGISGNMRKNKIKLLVGDKVDIEFSPYDLENGRIFFRR